MKNLWTSIKRDLWVVILDVVAVNASYILALLIRFYVNSTLRPVAVDRYLPAWIGFTPWYTVACIITFMLWKLYGGMWRYAGINDMNRIIGASVCTCLLHIIGTVAYFTRMPVTYYIIGAVLQLFLLITIRFAYRVLMVEKKKLGARRQELIPTVVIGAGENGRRVLKHLEESEVYKPVAILSSNHSTGSLMDGIPVQELGALSNLIERKSGGQNIGAVFIADTLLSTADREQITKLSESNGVDIMDYTGFISNLGGRLSLTELLATIHGPVTISVDSGLNEDGLKSADSVKGENTLYESGSAAIATLTDKYTVKEIDGENMIIRVEKRGKVNTEEALRAAYAAVTGS